MHVFCVQKKLNLLQNLADISFLQIWVGKEKTKSYLIYTKWKAPLGYVDKTWLVNAKYTII